MLADACTNPNFNYVLMHLSLGGGIAVGFIAVAAAVVAIFFILAIF